MLKNLSIFHIDCPKRGLGNAAPGFEDITRPRHPSIKLDHDFQIFRCPLCKLEISVIPVVGKTHAT